METLGWLIGKYIEESEQPGSRRLGQTQVYALRRIQKSALAAKELASMKPLDFLDYCKSRRAGGETKGVLPPTINQDITCISSALSHAVDVWELASAEHARAVLKKTKYQLRKQQLISSSAPRDRRPTPEELTRLFAYFDLEHDKHGKSVINMRQIAEWQIASGRRISETCRIRWCDVDFEKRLCTVRDLKNPNGKGFHGTFPLLGRAWEIILERQKQRKSTEPTERIFPYRSTSVSAAYTHAKKILGIKNLRLHDSRREAFSRLFEEGFSVPEVQQMSLHKNPTILLRTYTNIPPESLHRGPASKRNQPTEEQHGLN